MKPNFFSFNPLKTPGNWTLAKDHASATTPGLPKNVSAERQYVCPCCLLPLQKQPLPINFDSKKIEFLGYQYSLFFETMKISIMLVSVMLFNTGLIMFHDSLLISQQKEASSQFEISISPIQQQFPMSKFATVSVLGFILQLILIIIIKVIQETRINKKYSADNIRNYSIVVENVPKGSHTEQRIKTLFTSNFDHLQIGTVVLVHEWQTYRQAVQKVQESIKNWKKFLKNKDRPHQAVLQNLKIIEDSSENIHQVKKNITKETDTTFSGNAIVVFKTQEEKKQVMQAYKKGFFSKSKIEASLGQIKFNDKESIIMRDAPNFDQINWGNFSLARNQKLAKKRLSFISIGIIVITFFLISFISQLIFGRRIPTGDNPNSSQSVPILSLILLSVLSQTLLPFVLQQIEKFSKPQSNTQEKVNFSLKLYISSLNIRFLVVFLVQCIFNVQNASLNNQSLLSQSQQIATGTIVALTRFVIIDCIVVILLKLIDPMFIFKLVVKKIGVEKNSLSQQQVNQLLEKPRYKLSEKYMLCLITMSYAFMLSDIVPINLFLSAFSLFVCYWIEKLTFSKRSSVSGLKLNKEFSLTIIRIMQASLVMKPLVNLLMTGLSKKMANIPEIFMVLIAIGYLCAPKQIILDYIAEKLKIGSSNESKEEEKSTKINYHMQGLYQVHYPLTENFYEKITIMNKVFKKGCAQMQLKDYKVNSDGQEQSQVLSDLNQPKDGITKTCPIIVKEQIQETDRNLSAQNPQDMNDQ